MMTRLKNAWAAFLKWFGDGSLVSNPTVGFKNDTTKPETRTLVYGDPVHVSTIYPNNKDVRVELEFTNHMHFLTDPKLRVFGTFPKGNETRLIVDEHTEGRLTAFAPECVRELVVKNKISVLRVFASEDAYEGAKMTSPDMVSKPYAYPCIIKRDPEQVLDPELEEECQHHRARIRHITIEDYPWTTHPNNRPGSVIDTGVDRMVCFYMYYDEEELDSARASIEERRQKAEAKALLRQFINGSEESK